MKGAAHIKHLSREHDEIVLGWVRQRSKGKSAGTIARAAGKKSGPVITATNSVLKADISESGEPERAVRAGYWA